MVPTAVGDKGPAVQPSLALDKNRLFRPHNPKAGTSNPDVVDSASPPRSLSPSRRGTRIYVNTVLGSNPPPPPVKSVAGPQ